jgi:hypothetical protein
MLLKSMEIQPRVVKNVTIELSPKELGTLVAAFGMTSQGERTGRGVIPASNQMGDHESTNFYSQMYEMYEEIYKEKTEEATV